MIKKRIKNLLLAIDRTEGNACTYLYPDMTTPCCVIAQLAMIEGVPIEDIRGWQKGSIRVDVVILFKHSGYEALEKYPDELLAGLQEKWDEKDCTDVKATEEDTKIAMRKMVLEFTGKVLDKSLQQH